MVFEVPEQTNISRSQQAAPIEFGARPSLSNLALSSSPRSFYPQPCFTPTGSEGLHGIHEATASQTLGDLRTSKTSTSL